MTLSLQQESVDSVKALTQVSIQQKPCEEKTAQEKTYFQEIPCADFKGDLQIWEQLVNMGDPNFRIFLKA